MFLYPTYRQLLKQAPPVSTAVKVWNEETDLVIQDCFSYTNWDVFRTAAGGKTVLLLWMNMLLWLLATLAHA